MLEMTDGSTLPAHIPADAVTAFAISNIIFQWAPQVLTIMACVLGIVWYGVLFYDRFINKNRIDHK